MKNTERKEEYWIDGPTDAVIIGGTIGGAEVLLSSLIAAVSLPICGAAGKGAVGACWAIVSLAGYFIELNTIFGSCLPISGNPLVDQVVSVSLVGAAVGVGAYGLFGSQNNQAKAENAASESNKKFSPA